MSFPEKSSLVKKQNELITVYEEYIDTLNANMMPDFIKDEKTRIYKNKIEQLKNDIDWLQS